MSPLPSAIRCASVASTGAEVMIGEQIRTFSAWPIFFASREVSASANPGVNHGRTRTPSTTTGLGSTKPLCSTSPSRHSSSKSSVNACASSGEATVTTTFSCRDHESSVQFIEPVQTVSLSRTTNLWCIRSGTPAIALAGTSSAAISWTSGSGGGGTGIGFAWSTL